MDLGHKETPKVFHFILYIFWTMIYEGWGWVFGAYWMRMERSGGRDIIMKFLPCLDPCRARTANLAGIGLGFGPSRSPARLLLSLPTATHKHETGQDVKIIVMHVHENSKLYCYQGHNFFKDSISRPCLPHLRSHEWHTVFDIYDGPESRDLTFGQTSHANYLYCRIDKRKAPDIKRPWHR